MSKNPTFVIPHTGSNGEQNVEPFLHGISIASSSFRSKPINVSEFVRGALTLEMNHNFSASLPVGPLVTGSCYVQYSNDIGFKYSDSGQKDALAHRIRNWVTDETSRFFFSGSAISGATNSRVGSTGGTSTSSTSYPASFLLRIDDVNSRWARVCFDNANTAASGSLTGSITFKEY